MMHGASKRPVTSPRAAPAGGSASARASSRSWPASCCLRLQSFFLYRVLPLGWNVLLSLQYWSPLKPARWAGLDHYEEMLLYDEVFWQALKNTLIFIGVSTRAILRA